MISGNNTMSSHCTHDRSWIFIGITRNHNLAAIHWERTALAHKYHRNTHKSHGITSKIASKVILNRFDCGRVRASVCTANEWKEVFLEQRLTVKTNRNDTPTWCTKHYDTFWISWPLAAMMAFWRPRDLIKFENHFSIVVTECVKKIIMGIN